MGDPGLPIMAGALAVPVGVLLLVLVLAMMGRRWVLTGPDETFMAEYEARYADDDFEDFEPAPYGAAPAIPRHASSTAYDAYGSSAPDVYAAPPRDPYGTPVREPYASPRPSSPGVSDWEPYVPSPRRPQEASSWPSYGAPTEAYEAAPTDAYGAHGAAPADAYGAASTDAYGAAPGGAYGPTERDPYGSGGRDLYGSAGRRSYAAYDEQGDAAPARDRSEPPTYRDDPWYRAPEDPQGFPYGPYDSR
ncbi:hypothetical protein NE236_25755 [Actinoallomurus purpureus]|uniref:hypothetical protein n=1 Tax=Actinoallomurus purpureus TaxID=478114 RepID=UPI00209262BB|nr:hypothetical protein [Actinoallomurus purpureus]MCO6008387.1 hypothetical protein [Actinoallomurus purpureus]